MRVIVYMKDGVLQVVRPCSVDLEEQAWKRLPSGVNARWVDDSELPPNRDFRNAWGADLRVDMPKARDLHRETLRKLRAPKLAELDVEYIRADEAGNESRKSSIALRKQALRDVTADPEIEKASTPEELKAVLPEVLK